ncbi:MAG: penicillin acylase family protein, partial [Betaproteobacteria bacterium]
GYIVSANQEPAPGSGAPVAGYYELWDRAQELDRALRAPGVKWDNAHSQALQLDVRTGYAERVLKALLPVLRQVVSDPAERALLDQLAAWDGSHTLGSAMPTLFNQMLYELAAAAMSDELGEAQFKNLLQTHALDFALALLAADEHSPWWDNVTTPAKETRADTVKLMWRASIAHLQKTLGPDPAAWTWGKAHTLTHNHPLGQQKPLNKLFNVGPFAAPGGREIPNAMYGDIGPAPWRVASGPSTRRVIDFADAEHTQGINPVGQSGVLFDAHYSDQAADFIAGASRPQHLSEADVAAHTRSTLRLEPAR